MTRRASSAKVVAVLLLGTALPSCLGRGVEAPGPPALPSAATAATPAGADSALSAVRPAAWLTARERCVLAAYQERGYPDDACLIRCLAVGGGRNIGGGCWHVCHAYTGVPMTPLPEKAAACAALPDTTVRVRPASLGDRSLQRASAWHLLEDQLWEVCGGLPAQAQSGT